MRGPARKITYLSAEARERISRANAERWKNPEYRARHAARLQEARKKAGNFGGFKQGHKHSPEAIEKIRQASIERWKDPAYRAHNLPLLREKARTQRRKVCPPAGTPERRLYEKVRSILGAAAARSLQFKSAETDRAGAP